MRRHFRKGQSILEYTLLLGAIIAVIVAVLLGGKSSIKSKVTDTYTSFAGAIEKTKDDLSIGIFSEVNEGGRKPRR